MPLREIRLIHSCLGTRLWSSCFVLLSKTIRNWNLSHFLLMSTMQRTQDTNNGFASAAHDSYGKQDCLEGQVPTYRLQDFFFLIIHPHAGRQGVYISTSLRLGGEVILRIRTVTDTLFLAIQRGNIKVHTLLFWKIKPSVDGRTCLPKQSTLLGLLLTTLKHQDGFFGPVLYSPKLHLGHALNQEKLQGHCTTVRMRKVETLLWAISVSGHDPISPSFMLGCSISSSAPPKSHPDLGEIQASHTVFPCCAVQPFPSLIVL